VKPQIRRFAQTLSPELFRWCRSLHLRKRFCRQFKFDQRLFREAFYPGNRTPEVLTGPFRGMFYLDATVWGPITPKWAGTYEMELEDVIEEIIECGYDRIVNLGCAEGYYAVGLACRNHKAEVLAFDLDPFARTQVRRLAQLNVVSERIRVFGECTYFKLNELIKGKTLIVADIEGDEVVLLDPAKVPRLTEADLLIEIHDHPDPDARQTAKERVANRFSGSHAMNRRVSRDREDWIEKHQGLWQGKISRERMTKALDEARSSPQNWLWAKSK
jgi:hypothetical protein